MGYDWALADINKGNKSSYWIWLIFRHLGGHSHSRRSHFYGIADRTETEHYLAHPILGPRLKEIVEVTMKYTDISLECVLGDIDAQKIQSCMTFSNCISSNDIL